MICGIYVDVTVFTEPKQQEIDNEVKLLGIKQHNEEQLFEFIDEGKVS